MTYPFEHFRRSEGHREQLTNDIFCALLAAGVERQLVYMNHAGQRDFFHKLWHLAEMAVQEREAIERNRKEPTT